MEQTVHVRNASPAAVVQDNHHTRNQPDASDESDPLPPLYARCGFAEEDTKGWRDFRVTPLQAATDFVKFIVSMIMEEKGVNYSKPYEDQHPSILGNAMNEV